jgi:hypothetical protein
VLHVHVFNGAERSEFVYYDDDGETLDYRKGEFRKRVIAFDPAKKQLTISRPDGSFASPFRSLRLVLHGFEPLAGTTVNGTAAPVQSQVVRMLDPLEALSDVYYDEGYLESLRQLEPMKPQAILEFEDAEQIVVRLR